MDSKDHINHAYYDVVVVGGGIAGVAAAVTAARQGRKVILLEKLVNLGGLATEGLISYYEPLCNGRGEQVIYGMAEELIKLSVKYSFDTIPEAWKTGDREAKERCPERYYTYYSPTVFSIALDQYVLENGVDLQFDTLATSPVMVGKRCVGVIVETVAGKEFFPCGAVIDATGNATVMHRAGVPTVEGVNTMSYVTHGYDAAALSAGINPSQVRAWDWVMGDADLAANHSLKGVSAQDITEYVLYGKKQLLKKIGQKDRNGFDVMTLPGMAQIRKIRRIVGKTDFCADENAVFEDAIGICGDWRIDSKPGSVYQLPMGALYHEAFENLIAAGRIISAPEGDGWEVARVIPVCAMTGEAAGKIAALCTKYGCTVADVAREHFDELKI